MGEVYRARDTRLDRIVAVKVLPRPPRDPEPRRASNARREPSRALAHPHICTLHDIGEQDGIDYLVMEHLEGETLADRLPRRRLPLAEALRSPSRSPTRSTPRTARGIVHRDLKPGNVMLTEPGVGADAKLLDFGLAQASGEHRGAAGSDATVTAPLTGEGMIIGTCNTWRRNSSKEARRMHASTFSRSASSCTR